MIVVSNQIEAFTQEPIFLFLLRVQSKMKAFVINLIGLEQIS
jgi:hypothetical protein